MIAPNVEVMPAPLAAAGDEVDRLPNAETGGCSIPDTCRDLGPQTFECILPEAREPTLPYASDF